MNTLFQTILALSLSGGILVTVVALLRPLLKKAPKWLVCLLWIPVAIGLLLPVRPASRLSLMPDTEPVAGAILSVQPDASLVTPGWEPGQPLPVITPDEPVFVFQFWMLWVAGMIAMTLYGIISYFLIRRKVAVCLETAPGIYLCDDIGSPFILGLFRPRVYLPSSLSPENARAVLAHENAHLRRKDHWWKPLGFLLLTIHWFNPLVWLGYILLCRDIELACDEKVIRDMGPEFKKTYSEALLVCSIRRRAITACPLAFGEVGVKARVRSILAYKKPAFWIVIAALLAVIAVGVCFLTERPEPTYFFDARIIEYPAADVLLLEPLPGYPIRNSTDRVQVRLPEGTDAGLLIQRGYVRVEYDGMVQETYPARIPNVISLVAIDPPESQANPSFQAYVLDTGSGYMLLQPREGTPLRQEASKVAIYHDKQMLVPTLSPGDLVAVEYRGGMLYSDPPQFRDILSVELVQEADWCITMDVVTVSPTGATLRLLQSSGWPRDLRYDHLYRLERFTENGWEKIKDDDLQIITTEWIGLANGIPQTLTLNWSDRYGSLPAGRYRIVKNISCFTLTSEKVNVYYGEFAIGAEYSGDFEDALTQMIYSALLPRFPELPADAAEGAARTAPELQEEPEETYPPEYNGLKGGLYIESHMILEHMTLGQTHAVALNVLCRRYHQGTLYDEIYTPMLLRFTEKSTGAYDLTESRVPREGSFQHDIETYFPAAAVEKALNCKQYYQQLSELCEMKVSPAD